MKYFYLGFLLAIVAVISIAGFRGSMSRKPPIEVFPDMDRQPKLRPQAANGFFSDGLSSRRPPAETIARGSHWQDIPLNTGHVTGSTNFVELNPLPITSELLARGKQRFQISCLPCHGPLADGNGITKKFGMAVVANLHDKRIVSMNDGEIFNVITYGRNLMGPYGPNVAIEDRWAIIAYVRALQLAALGTANDVPASMRTRFAK
jgi:hypothetical protein